jgi:ABC-type branched-subunit amino acid transport system substrate-binding protein
MFRRVAATAVALASMVGAAFGQTPGISETEIKIGATFPFSGPASPLSNTGKGLIAYVNSVNERGGINGRKINLITYDDAYSPPKTVEQTRKLIEGDEVAFLFGPLGTPGIAATIKYVNTKKVPHLFVVSGVTKFTNFAEFPMTATTPRGGSTRDTSLKPGRTRRSQSCIRTTISVRISSAHSRVT